MQLLMTKQHLARHHQMLRRMQCKYLPARSATRKVRRGTQRYSEVLRGTQRYSDALRRPCTQCEYGAVGGGKEKGGRGCLRIREIHA